MKINNTFREWLVVAYRFFVALAVAFLLFAVTGCSQDDVPEDNACDYTNIEYKIKKVDYYSIFDRGNAYDITLAELERYYNDKPFYFQTRYYGSYKKDCDTPEKVLSVNVSVDDKYYIILTSNKD